MAIEGQPGYRETSLRDAGGRSPRTGLASIQLLREEHLNVGNAPISEMFGNHDLPSACAAGLVIMGVMIPGGEAAVGHPIIRIILMSVFIPMSWFIPVFSACLTGDS